MGIHLDPPGGIWTADGWNEAWCYCSGYYRPTCLWKQQLLCPYRKLLNVVFVVFHMLTVRAGCDEHHFLFLMFVHFINVATCWWIKLFYRFVLNDGNSLYLAQLELIALNNGMYTVSKLKTWCCFSYLRNINDV